MKKILLQLLLLLPITSVAQHFIPVTPSLLNNKADTVVVVSPYNVAVINNVFKQRNQLRSLANIQGKALLQSDLIQHQMTTAIHQRDSLIHQNSLIINRYQTLSNNQEKQIAILQQSIEKQRKKKNFYKKTTIITVIATVIATLKLCNVF